MEDLPYTHPADRLLDLGEPTTYQPPEWEQYVNYGIATDDVAQLARLVRDEQFNAEEAPEPARWAPVHAWRALGQLRAAEATPALLSALEQRQRCEDQWSTEELPAVLRMIGPAAVPALAAFISDPARQENARALSAEALGRIGAGHPDCRQACVAAITTALEHFAQNPTVANTGMVYALLDLKAVEAAPLLRRVFVAEKVDKFMVGDWGDIRRELKLEREEGDPPERPRGKSLWDGTPLGDAVDRLRRFLTAGRPPGVTLSRADWQDRDKARARRKQERRTRRKNRRHH
jgi:hypothetical protein